MNSGIVATTIAVRLAFASWETLHKESGIQVYPIIAAGALPFRGGLSPLHVKKFASTYQGVRTAVIQSSYRYDYDLSLVKKGIGDLKNLMSETAPIPSIEEQHILECAVFKFQTLYRDVVTHLAPKIHELAPYIPKRRERFLHIGLFGYSRAIGMWKLPRAIGFTACCYSLGLPPEFFGVGRGIAWAKKQGILPIIEKWYPSIRDDLHIAGRFFRREAVKELGFPGLIEDIQQIEKFLGTSLGPYNDEEHEHVRISKKIAGSGAGDDRLSFMEKAAVLRNSIG